MNYFKTPKGTELPIMDIRGKAYLQVAHRLVWMREDHPDWSISTDYIELAAEHAICKAVISDNGKVIATGHKYEDRKGFPDFIEKSETGAIGRALAACGYGTQFAPELEEGERLADAPTSRPPINPSNGARPAVSAAPEGNSAKNDGITEKQQKRLFAISKETNWSNEDVKKYLEQIGLSHSSELNWIQYEALIANMQKYHKN